MRLLHTADWHLGHTLHNLTREFEHQRFLDWLEDEIAARAIDVLIIAGDVFHSANPPAEAQGMLYRFLARLRARFSRLSIVIVGGNHDSATRLEAPNPLLLALGVRIVGQVHYRDGELDLDGLLMPLCDREGAVAAWCCAVPYLRPSDLPPVAEAEGVDPLVEGVRSLYARVLEAARRRRQPGQALVATGHCYMVGTDLSRLSERRVLGGNQHALPADIFPDDVAYCALGHLHRAQRVGGRDAVRYSGSPIPLAVDEDTYRHQVVVVEIDGEAAVSIEAVRVPRAVQIIRLGHGAPLPVDALAQALRGLPLDAGLPEWQWPYLEVSVRLDKPDPGLGQKLAELTAPLPARLVAWHASHAGRGRALADAAPERLLNDLPCEEVFRLCYARKFDTPPDSGLLAAFSELVEQVEARR